MEGAFIEMPKGRSFGLNVLLRVNGGKPLGMLEMGWHAQHRRATLCDYATPSCFVAGAFPGYRCVGININERR